MFPRTRHAVPQRLAVGPTRRGAAVHVAEGGIRGGQYLGFTLACVLGDRKPGHGDDVYATSVQEFDGEPAYKGGKIHQHPATRSERKHNLLVGWSASPS